MSFISQLLKHRLTQVFTALSVSVFLISCIPQTDEDNTEPSWQVIFNGHSLEGWTAQIAGNDLGQDPRQTFRAKDGIISVDYSNYDGFENQFGNLFYKEKLSDYRLKLEYRFLGEQLKDGPQWAHLNSGVMLLSQDPKTLRKDQYFPVSIEAQLLAAYDAVPERKSANVCSIGTHIYIGGALITDHCINSSQAAPKHGEWAQFEADVKGNASIKLYHNGKLAFELTNPHLDLSDKDAQRLKAADIALSTGFIALQSESHPVEFRNIRLLNRAKIRPHK